MALQIAHTATAREHYRNTAVRHEMGGIIPWRLRAAFYRKVQARHVDCCSRHGMVSFTFDDFPRSALETGGAILAANGLRGTYYTAAGLAGRASPMGPMFGWQDLVRASAQGHEIGAHTFAHVGVPHLGRSELLADIAQNGRALEAFQPRNFSYPMGGTDFAAAALLARHFDSCRSIEPGVNGEAADLNLLKAVALYESTEEQAVMGWIAEARWRRAWLILYTHDVADGPSPFGCSVGRFERIVAAARASGAMVAPVRECLAALAAPAPVAPEPAPLTA